MAVDISDRRAPAPAATARRHDAGQDRATDPRQRAQIQLDIVAQRGETRVALARILRERLRQKAAAGLAEEDARGPADWLEILSEHALRSVGEEHEADRQFALTQIAAAALGALESSQRLHGELHGVGELES